MRIGPQRQESLVWLVVMIQAVTYSASVCTYISEDLVNQSYGPLPSGALCAVAFSHIGVFF